jgi:hypothetical protein
LFDPCIKECFPVRILRASRGWVWAGAIAFALSVDAPLQAGLVIDAAGDFLATYVGPQNGDLDVLEAAVDFSPAGDQCHLSALLAADVGGTATSSYVFGFDRGTGAPGFLSIGIDQVIFDSVVILNGDGSGGLLFLIPEAVAIPISPSDIEIDGARIAASITASLLTSRGFEFADYTWNLWPGLPGGPTNVADFAPDNAMERVRTTPEPSSAVLCTLGVACVLVCGRYRAARGLLPRSS